MTNSETIPSRRDFVRVGQYVRSADPEMARQLKEYGYGTAQAVGEYTFMNNPEAFADILADITI